MNKEKAKNMKIGKEKMIRGKLGGQIRGSSKLCPSLPVSPELILTNDAGSFGGEAAVLVVAEKKSRKLEQKQSVADIRLISFPGREEEKEFLQSPTTFIKIYNFYSLVWPTMEEQMTLDK